MTGYCNLISKDDWICVTYSGRGDQTAHHSGIIIKISHLVKLLMPLLDSKILENLDFDNVHLRQGEGLAIASSWQQFLATIEFMSHILVILVEVITLQTTVVKISRCLI